MVCLSKTKGIRLVYGHKERHHLPAYALIIAASRPQNHVEPTIQGSPRRSNPLPKGPLKFELLS